MIYCPLRIAGIRYLNAAPYTEPLLSREIEHDATIIPVTPTQANKGVLSGEYDAGLISSAAYLRDLREGRENAALVRIPGFEIAGCGPSYSIRLFRRRPWYALEKIAVTMASETSVELLKILLAEDNLTAAIVPDEDPISRLRSDSTFDAALLIGDEALSQAAGGWQIDDLGDRWWDATRLPMVYAVLALRREKQELAQALEQLFMAALRWSEENREELLRRYPVPIAGASLTPEEYLEHFDRGRVHPDKEKALSHFASKL